MSINLENITILIPTYQRKKYLFKNLKFWENYKINIIILDGGQEPINQNNFKNFKNNIKYFLFKNCNFEKRLYIGSQKVKTPYCVLLGDDELHVPSALKKSINFLRKNQDYGCCIGRCVGFKSTNKYLSLWPEKVIQSNHFVNQNKSLLRMNYHIKNFTPSTLYAVHTIQSFKFSTKIFKNLKFDSPYIQETIFELLASTYSKCKVLPYLSWYRNFENKPIIDKNSKRLYFLSDWFFEKKNIKIIQILKKDLLNLILTLRENEKKVIKQNIEKILNHRILADKQNTNEAKLRYKFQNDNFIQNIFKRIKIYFKFVLIDYNFGNFCFFVDKNKYNYSKLYKAKIKFKIRDLNFINSYLLEKNDIKNR